MNLEIVILAAGQGTRMKSDLPKVLHPVGGRPMLVRVIDTALALEPEALHVVTGHGSDRVRQAMADYQINWVIQEEQLGTGHAVMQVLPFISRDNVVLVLYGDVPLTRQATLRALVEAASSGPALLTATVADATGYGRILRSEQGDLTGVVEHKDAGREQLAIREINTGLLAAPGAMLAEYLPRVGNDNQQGEYYLPDVLGLAAADDIVISSCSVVNEVEILGVNDRAQLAQVEREFQRRQAQALLREGVSIADPDRIDIRGSLHCESDVFIDVNVVFEGDVRLGRGASIGANCVLIDTTLGEGATIHPMSHLQEAEVGPEASVGPYARLRPGTELGAGARIGNFVETKKAQIGAGSKVNHLSYVGDCDMGAGVNIGAGTITCNYDGVNKHSTEIGDGVFVGSNSTLVAPLVIDTDGFVAAGTTVTRPVGAAELAVGRARQKNIQGWERPGEKAEKD